MNVVGGLALYFVIWWITLFAVLPFGIRSQQEAGDVVEGTEPGAPILPGLLQKGGDHVGHRRGDLRRRLVCLGEFRPVGQAIRLLIGAG